MTDPLRAKYVAEHYLENPVLFNDVRNMFGYTGMYKGREISVMGSGMGMPSFTLYAYELFHFFGVEAIIRIGSAGGLTDDTHLRDLIIAMSASTNSGMATSYGVPVAWWDNGSFHGNGENFGIFSRATGKAEFPEIIEMLVSRSLTETVPAE